MTSLIGKSEHCGEILFGRDGYRGGVSRDHKGLKDVGRLPVGTPGHPLPVAKVENHPMRRPNLG